MRAPAQRHLDGLHARLETVGEQVRALSEELRDDQLLWRPDPDRWGVADCFEHLIQSDSQYFPRLRAAIDGAAPAAEGERIYAPGLFARWFVRSVGPDGKMKLPAPKGFRPPPAGPDALERFLVGQRKISAFVEEARGIDLQSARLASPVSPLVRFTVGEALTLIVAHQERHLKQALAVREEPGFPT